MNILTPAEMKQADSETIRSGLFSGIGLMRSAGNAAAGKILQLTGGLKHCFHILTGSGNNGGDGFIIAARLLEQFGRERVVLHCAAPEEKLSGDALPAYQGLPPDIRKKTSLTAEDLDKDRDLVIDCLLGTGIKGDAREPVKSWISLVNRSGCPVISIDIPSGLDGETGTGDAVIADATLTLAAPKTGLLTGNGPSACGKLYVVPIGIPDKILNAVAPDAPPAIDTSTVRTLLHPLDPATYKQKRGHILILGGSATYPSAPFLAGEAALRAGAGLVTVVIPASAEIVCSVPKALIVRRAPDDGTGHFTAASLPLIQSLLPAMDAVAVGPGMTTAAGDFLAGLMNFLTIPTLFDADALNLLSATPELLKQLPENTVLTPHAGELKRLLTAANLSDIEQLAKNTKSIIVQKGPYSRIFDGSNGRKAVNLSGSPALATAGSGDVLTGITGAFLAQKYDPFTAAQIGVHLHGLTGENHTDRLTRAGNTGLIADDLLARLPVILQKFCEFDPDL
ncbi:MAG: NAD(P)H-hydrate dehydratase [Lentisphaeria bacterium]|nr:NAD(P)H-hydrate dehydratase [Lentisphaeria bacterium]